MKGFVSLKSNKSKKKSNLTASSEHIFKIACMTSLALIGMSNPKRDDSTMICSVLIKPHKYCNAYALNTVKTKLALRKATRKFSRFSTIVATSSARPSTYGVSSLWVVNRPLSPSLISPVNFLDPNWFSKLKSSYLISIDTVSLSPFETSCGSVKSILILNLSVSMA